SAGIGRESEPPRVPSQPEQPRRVIAEAALVEHPKNALLEIVARVGDREQRSPLGSVELQRGRVDGEVAPLEILIDRRRLDIRKRARSAVALAPRPRDVVARAVELDGAGSE